MPYIDMNTRTYIIPTLNPLLRAVVGEAEGTLNYVITRLLIAWAGPNPTYSKFNAVIGVLHCVESELYRRMVAPYEDVKRAEHGDVYPRGLEMFPSDHDLKGDTPHERE